MDARLAATYERLLADPDRKVRLDAAAGLARGDVEAGVKAYLGLSTDPDSSAALLAADGLAGLGRRQLAVDACLLVADRDVVFEACGRRPVGRPRPGRAGPGGVRPEYRLVFARPRP